MKENKSERESNGVKVHQYKIRETNKQYIFHENIIQEKNKQERKHNTEKTSKDENIIQKKNIH